MLLPRELRDEVYLYTILSQLKTLDTHSTLPPGAAGMNPQSRDNSPFWGRKPMSRLLRVSHQVHDEAKAIMYARFTLPWPKYTSKELVHKVLDPLNLKLRQSIKSVELHMTLRTLGGYKSRYEDDEDRNNMKQQWKLSIARLVWLLPGLKRVELALELDFKHLVWAHVQNTANLALDLVSPLQELKLDVLKVALAEHNERGWKGQTMSAIAEDMNAKIQSGNW